MALESPGTGAPLFRRVADTLADAIDRGDYPVGTRFLGVRVKSITQELEPVVLDAEQAARLLAPMGGPAMLVRRWYFLDDAVALLISRSVYPHGRLLFRTDLRRNPAPFLPQVA